MILSLSNVFTSPPPPPLFLCYLCFTQANAFLQNLIHYISLCLLLPPSSSSSFLFPSPLLHGKNCRLTEPRDKRDRRRSSIVVIPPMQICPGDLLVYSKVINSKNASLFGKLHQFYSHPWSSSSSSS